nr:MAG TPA: hypothetical protein [Caudoviricetes sp.]
MFCYALNTLQLLDYKYIDIVIVLVAFVLVKLIY